MPKKVQLLFQMDETLHRAAKVKAAQTSTSMASICRRALRKWIEEDQQPPAPHKEQTIPRA